jgi:hypothetical protein
VVQSTLSILTIGQMLLYVKVLGGIVPVLSPNRTESSTNRENGPDGIRIRI